jgi:hypothetical protein
MLWIPNVQMRESMREVPAAGCIELSLEWSSGFLRMQKQKRSNSKKTVPLGA